VTAVPRFDRSIEIARVGAILIDRRVRLLLTEGNCLLLDDPQWPSLRPHFDVTILVMADMEILKARLRERWLDHGLDGPAIRAKLEENDLPNARLVLDRSTEPDWVVRSQWVPTSTRPRYLSSTRGWLWAAASEPAKLVSTLHVSCLDSGSQGR